MPTRWAGGSGVIYAGKVGWMGNGNTVKSFYFVGYLITLNSWARRSTNLSTHEYVRRLQTTKFLPHEIKCFHSICQQGALEGEW